MRRLWVVALVVASCGGSSTNPPADLDWSELASMPTPRAEIQAVELDGLIYAVGGLSDAGGFSVHAELEAYEIATDTWLELAPLPEPIHHAITVGYHHHLYVFGGLTESWEVSDRVYRYNPRSDRWLELSPLPVPMSSGVALAVEDEVVYVIPGVGAEATMWAYHPGDDEWDNLDGLAEPRDHLSAVLHDGKIYVSGGRWSISGELSSVEVYDIETETWSFIASMADRRSGHGMAGLDGELWVFGGEVLADSTALASVERYDISADTWTSLGDLDQTIHGTSAVVVDGLIYLVGGSITVNSVDATGRMRALTP